MKTSTERAALLFQDSSQYHLKDTRWKNNFLARCRRIAKDINPKDPGNCDDINRIVMMIDIIEIRIGRHIWRN